VVKIGHRLKQDPILLMRSLSNWMVSSCIWDSNERPTSILAIEGIARLFPGNDIVRVTVDNSRVANAERLRIT
jgi:hypothetical protein